MRSIAPRVLQATAWYPPHSVGGTEVYLDGLVTGLAAHGVGSTIIVPRHADAAETYEYGHAAVETYPVNEVPMPNELRDGTRHQGFDKFINRLRAHKGAIYHQHSWSRGCGLHHLCAARAMGFHTVVTVHVPGVFCLRGTMMRFGAKHCNGRVEERMCGACWAQERGLPRPLASMVAQLPIAVARSVHRRTARLATALSARALGAERLANVREMIANADRIVAVCSWLYDALAANGVPRAKLTLSRQGISPALLSEVSSTVVEPRRGGPLRLLYVGRWHKVKGIDVIVRAVCGLSAHVDVRLTIHAIAPGAGEEDYEAEVRALAGTNSRIAFKAPVPRNGLIELLSQHDVLVVPSVWLETGPLVVLEAQAAGLFVLGSRLGGIAELIEGTDFGMLVAAGDSLAWTKAIEHLASQHAAGRLSRVLRKVRTMDAVASEMADIYRLLAASKEADPAHRPNS